MNTKLLLRNGLFLSVFLGAALIPYQEVVAQGDRPMSTPDSRVSRELWDIWRQGFEYYEKGEMKMISGKYSEALPLYQKSLDSFQEVRRQNPRWNRSVIDYRMNLCRRRLLTAKRRADESAQEMREAVARSQVTLPSAPVQTSRTAASTAAQRDFEARLQKTAQENELRKKQIADLQSELARLRPDAAKANIATKQIQGLMAERDQLDKQLASLKLQFNKLQEEQPKTTPRTAELERLLSAEQNKSTAYVNAFRTRSKQYNQLEDQYRLLRAAKDKQDAAYAELSKKYAAELQSSSGMARQNADKMNSLNKSLTQSKKEIDSLKTELEKKSKELQNSQAELRKLRSGNISSADTAKKIESEAVALRQENQKYRSELERLRNERRDLDMRTAKLDAEIARLKKELVINIEQKNDFSKANDSISKQFGELEASFKKTSAENAALRKELDKAVKERELFASKVNDQLNESLKNQLSASRREAAQLTKELNEIKRFGNPAELKAKLAVSESQFQKMKTDKDAAVRSSADAQRQYKETYAALQARLKEIDSLNSKLQESRTQSLKLSDELKQQLDANAKLAANTKVSSETADKTIQSLRNQEQTVRNELNSEIQKRQNLAETHSIQLKQRDESISKLAEELKNSNTRLQNLTEEGKQLKQQQKELLASIQQEKKKSETRLTELQKQLAALKTSNAELKDQADSLNKINTNMKTDYAALDQRNKQLKSDYAALEQNSKHFKNNYIVLQKDNASLKLKITSLQNDLTAQSRKNVSLSSNLQKQAEEVQILQAKLQSEVKVKDSTVLQIASAEETSKQLRRDNQQLKKDISVLRFQLSEVAKTGNTPDAKITVLASQLQTLQTQNDQIEKLYAAANSQKTTLEKELNSRKVQIIKLENEQTALSLKKTSLERELALCQTKIEQLEKTTSALNIDKSAVEKARAEAKASKDELAFVQNQLIFSQNKVRELNIRIAEIQKQTGGSLNDLKQKDKMIRDLEQQLAAERTKQSSLQSDLAIAKTKLAEANADLKSTKEKLAAVSAPVQSKKETSPEVLAQIDSLKKELAKTKTDLANTTSELTRNRTALSDLERLFNLESARLKAAKKRLAVIEKGFTDEKSPALAAKTASKSATLKGQEQLAQVQKNYDELKKNLAEKEKALTDADAKYQQKCKELTNLEKQLDAKQKELVSMQTKLQDSNNNKETTEKQLIIANRALADKTKETIRLTQEITLLQNTLREVGAERAQLASDYAKLKRTLPGVQELANAKKAVAQAEISAKRLQYEKNSLEKVIADLHKKNGAMQKVLDKTQTTLTARNDEINRLTQELGGYENARKEIVQLKQQLATSKEETALAQKNAAQNEQKLKKEIQQYAGQVLNLRDMNTHCMEQITELTARRNHLESLAKKSEKEIAHLKKELAKALSEEEKVKLKKRITELGESLKLIAKGSDNELVKEAVNKNLVINELLIEQLAYKSDIRKLNASVETYRVQIMREQEKVDKAENMARVAVYDARSARAQLKNLRMDVEDGVVRMPTAQIAKSESKSQVLAGLDQQKKTTATVKVTPVTQTPKVQKTEKPVIAEKSVQPRNHEYADAMKQGAEAENSGDLGMALWHYWRAADAEAKKPEPYFALCRLHIKRKERDSAIKTYRKAIDLGGKPDPDLENKIKKL